MPRRRLALVVLACAVVAATGLRVAGGAEKRGLTHDESISYLAAACHQGDYARLTVAGTPPFGRWAPASKWKDLLRPERPLCLATIARDLAHEDVHPPLYFWLLHGWALVFGAGLWTGPSLNVALAVLTTLALFGLGRRVLGDPLRAALVAFTWSFSPAAIRVFAEARQYELLALLATLFVWQCVRVGDPTGRSSRRDLLRLAGITAAGALSQFLFALVALAGAALILARGRGSGRRLAVGGLASIAAGYAAFARLDPGFASSLARGRGQAVEPAAELLGGRADATARTAAELLLPPDLARGWLGYAVVAALLATAVWLVLRRPRDADGARPEGTAMVLVFLWLAAAHAALFLSFLTPGGAMDIKHLSPVWPFAAFVPVLALARVPRPARAPVAAAGALALLVAGAVAVLGLRRSAGPPSALERTRVLVLDNVARGVLPRVVGRVGDRTWVFAADQRRLLARRAEWLPHLPPGTVLLAGIPASDPRYGNGPRLARRVRAEVARRYRLTPVPDPLEPGHVFRVGAPVRRAAPARP